MSYSCKEYVLLKDEMAVTLRASIQGLDAVDRARRKKGWTANSSQWVSKACVSVATLKRFRRGISIRQEYFTSICQAVGIDWEEVVDSNPRTDRSSSFPRPDLQANFSAYDEYWVGRSSLVAELTERARSGCRVLMIMGMAGIGKTALAERLVEELRTDWPRFYEEKFDNEHEFSAFGSVAARWLEQWGESVTPEDRQNTKQLLHRLVHKLCEEPHLVVMDALEFILQGNQEEGWSDFKDNWWVVFFEQLLRAPTCASRLILTSQDFPGQLPERYQAFLNYCVVQGLARTEQLALFEKTGLDLEADTQRSYLERISKAYEGHPLALRVIAGEIGSARFGGNAELYWQKYGHEIEEVEKALAEADLTTGKDIWNLHRYTRELRRRVRSRLEYTFERLKQDSVNGYRLLCAASVYRCAVPEDFWFSLLEDWGCNQEQSELALETLEDRHLVEREFTLIRQNNLIRSLSIEHLKAMDNN